jgi:hypothetical protein
MKGVGVHSRGEDFDERWTFSDGSGLDVVGCCYRGEGEGRGLGGMDTKAGWGSRKLLDRRDVEG